MKFLKEWLNFQLTVNGFAFAAMTIMFISYTTAYILGWIPPPT
jgi:hypothetical protein